MVVSCSVFFRPYGLKAFKKKSYDFSILSSYFSFSFVNLFGKMVVICLLFIPL